MSDPATLNRILHDLAEGKIDADQASGLIADLDAPAARPADESLYDAPPARALDDDAADEQPAEAADNGVPADDSDGQPASPRPTEQPQQPDPATPPHDEKTAGNAGEPGPTGWPKSDSDQGATTPAGHSLFDIQMDDVAAVAGEVFRDAGEIARGAWQRLGSLASSVLPGDAAPSESSGADTTTQAAAPTSRPPSGRSVRSVIVRSVGRRVRIIGDHRTASVTVEGPHNVRREGAVLEISTEGEIGLNTGGFNFIRPPRSIDDLRVLGFGQELVVRVNPAIRVDAEVTGSKLTTSGVPTLGSIRVSVGQASLSDVVQIEDALIQAGGASLSGPISEGRSRIKVESGNLTVRLTQGASVTVRSQSQLGRISWPGDPQDLTDEYVVGNGSAALEISLVMSRVVVKADE